MAVEQSRISFNSTSKRSKSQSKQLNPPAVIKRRPLSPLPQVSYEDDPRALGLLQSWTDDAPKYHQRDLSNIEKLMGQFDNRMEFGPCTGITRLERWQRAQKLNLNPPDIIRDILESTDKYSTCVYD